MSPLCLQNGASLFYPQLSLRVGTKTGGTGLVQSCKRLSSDLCFEWISRKLLQVSSGLRECSGSTPGKEAPESLAERQDVCPVGSLMLGLSHLHILNIVAETTPPTSW